MKMQNAMIKLLELTNLVMKIKVIIHTIAYRFIAVCGVSVPPGPLR